MTKFKPGPAKTVGHSSIAFIFEVSDKIYGKINHGYQPKQWSVFTWAIDGTNFYANELKNRNLDLIPNDDPDGADIEFEIRPSGGVIASQVFIDKIYEKFIPSFDGDKVKVTITKIKDDAKKD